MATLVLPATPQGQANFNFRVELEGVEYEFRMRFNSRDSVWYLSIRDADGAQLVDGLRVVPNTDVTLRFTVDGAFPGRIYVLDSRAIPEPPTLTNLGSDLPMVYDEKAA